MDISDIHPPPPGCIKICWGISLTYSHEPTHRAYQVKHTGNRLGWTRGKWDGRWVASASRGGGVDERTVGGSSMTRWDATTSQCEWWEAEAACWKDERRRRCDNRGDTTTSWRIRGQREGRRLQTGGGGSLRGREVAAARREASWQSAGGTSRPEAALFRLWTRQTSTIMQYSTGIYVGISTEKIIVRQS